MPGLKSGFSDRGSFRIVNSSLGVCIFHAPILFKFSYTSVIRIHRLPKGTFPIDTLSVRRLSIVSLSCQYPTFTERE
jgi:hypothetical protein